MRPFTTLTLMAFAAGSLAGCAQIGSAADTLWGGTKSAAKWVSTPVRSLLRDAPEPEYQFAENPYAGGEVILYADVPSTDTGTPAPDAYFPVPTASYSTGQFYGADDAVQTAEIATADSLAFVRLNGNSDMLDWRTCENLYRGYWLVDAAGGRINPEFEVCMRNKGYVLESELAIYGLRDGIPVRGQSAQPSTWNSGYTPLP